MGHVAIPSYRSGFYSPKRGGIPKYPQLWRGCVGAWCPSLGPTGLRLMDQSLYGNHGTLTGYNLATDWTTDEGMPGLANGENKSVRTFGMSGVSFGISASISVFVSLANATPSVGGRTGLFNTHSSVSGAGSHYPWTDGNIYTGWLRTAAGRVTVTPTSLINRALPHLVTVTTDGNRWRFYQGPYMVSDVAAQATVEFSSSQFAIGHNLDGGTTPTYFLDGTIYEARLYNRALTQSEVRLLAQRPGIAYELDRTRNRYAAPASGTNRRRRIICGASV